MGPKDEHHLLSGILIFGKSRKILDFRESKLLGILGFFGRDHQIPTLNILIEIDFTSSSIVENSMG